MYSFLQEQWTPLIFASAYGQAAVIEVLIKHGAKLDVKNNVNYPLLIVSQLTVYSPFRREGQLYLWPAMRDTVILRRSW